MVSIGSDEWIQPIDNAVGVEAGVGYAIGAHVTVGLRSGYAYGSHKIPIMLGFDPSDPSEFVDVDLEWRIADVPLILTLGYGATKENWSTLVEIGGEVHFVEFSSRTPEVESQGVDAHKHVWGEETTFGAHAAVAVEWALAKKLCLGGRAGYRVAEVTQFDDFTVDLDGWFFGLFVGVKPWA